METNRKIRLASESDCSSILEIYSPYIKNTAITFEYEVPTLAEMANRIIDIRRKYPWLLCEIDGKVAGYAYASPFRVRAAYEWSVDFSVYIRSEYHGKKIGKALYSALFEILKLQGYYNAFAGVTLPNVKSESLHESFGFKPIGVYKNVGYKFDNWHDVKWFQVKLQEYSKSPSAPKPINEVAATLEYSSIIEKAEQMILI